MYRKFEDAVEIIENEFIIHESSFIWHDVKWKLICMEQEIFLLNRATNYSIVITLSEKNTHGEFFNKISWLKIFQAPKIKNFRKPIKAVEKT